MVGGFSLDQFMNGCTKEDIAAFAEALEKHPLHDPFPPGHVGDWMDQLRQDNENQRKALQLILDLRGSGESLCDAQMIAGMVLNPQDYDLESRQAQGLR